MAKRWGVHLLGVRLLSRRQPCCPWRKLGSTAVLAFLSLASSLILPLLQDQCDGQRAGSNRAAPG